MNVYLARKNGEVIHHASLEAMAQMDGIEEAELTIAEEEWEAAGGLARIIGGEIVLGKTQAELVAEDAAAEILEIKGEIAARDYRALKAMKLGEDLDSIYPGESEWYQGRLSRMEELEEIIAAAS
jgi:hypothetical protein